MLFILPVFCQAQLHKLPIDSDTHKVTYQEIVKVDGVNKDELYVRAREWFALTFKSSKDVIQMDDKAAGKIIGKGSSEGSTKYRMLTMDYWLNYTVSITVKEGRYRYEITDFVIENKPSQYVPSVMPMTAEVFYNTVESNNNFLSKKNAAQMESMYNTYIDKIESVGTRLADSLKDALYKKGKAVKSKDDF